MSVDDGRGLSRLRVGGKGCSWDVISCEPGLKVELGWCWLRANGRLGPLPCQGSSGAGDARGLVC